MVDGVVEQNPDLEADWDANEETIVLEDAQYVEARKEADPELERERREAQGRDLRAAGWTEDAIFLFQKLGMRGFEPLLPHAWFEDFTMLPADLFTRNIDKAFIKPMSADLEYHGQLEPHLHFHDIVLTIYQRTVLWPICWVLVVVFAMQFFRKRRYVPQNTRFKQQSTSTTGGRSRMEILRIFGTGFLSLTPSEFPRPRVPASQKPK